VNLAVLFAAALLSACTAGDRRVDTSAVRDTDAGATVAAVDTARAAVPAVTTDSVKISASATAASPPPASTASRPKPATAAPTSAAKSKDSANTKPTGALSEQGVDREIARAVAAWRNVRTLRAMFQQTVTNPITGSELNSRGELQQQKPSKLAITFTDPAGDRIISDGQYVWVYLQSATPGQVVRMRVTDVGAANTDLIGQFLNTPRSGYDATDAGADRVGDRDARAIVLVAKQGERLPFLRAKVWIDAKDALIRQFEAVDANGISRKVRILTMSPNAAVDASAFKFEVPAGVRIIER
jgi:outer membrane lipoprotein carrier protein